MQVSLVWSQDGGTGIGPGGGFIAAGLGIGPTQKAPHLGIVGRFCMSVAP